MDPGVEEENPWEVEEAREGCSGGAKVGMGWVGKPGVYAVEPSGPVVLPGVNPPLPPPPPNLPNKEGKEEGCFGKREGTRSSTRSPPS